MRTIRLEALIGALATVVACSGSGANTGKVDTTSGTVASARDTAPTVRGTITSLSKTSLALAADSGTVTVRLRPPVQVYERQPATLADVKDNAFIGVTTVKQPDGTERATEIHIFPEALRGLGEGSRMMSPATGAAPGSRTTNGAVSGSRMTNGTTASSRMSNGSVTGMNGSSFTVQYAGGSQNVVVPSNTPVTEIKQTSTPLSQGEQVVVLAKRDAQGTLTATSVLLSRR